MSVYDDFNAVIDKILKKLANYPRIKWGVRTINGKEVYCSMNDAQVSSDAFLTSENGVHNVRGEIIVRLRQMGLSKEFDLFVLQSNTPNLYRIAYEIKPEIESLITEFLAKLPSEPENQASAQSPAPKDHGYAAAPAPTNNVYAAAPAPTNNVYAAAPAPTNNVYAAAPPPRYGVVPPARNNGYAPAPLAARIPGYMIPPPPPNAHGYGAAPLPRDQGYTAPPPPPNGHGYDVAPPGRDQNHDAASSPDDLNLALLPLPAKNFGLTPARRLQYGSTTQALRQVVTIDRKLPVEAPSGNNRLKK